MGDWATDERIAALERAVEELTIVLQSANRRISELEDQQLRRWLAKGDDF